MKKIIVITFFLALATLESANGQINIHFSAGANNSNCKFENHAGISLKSNWGYFMGIAPGYQINDKIQFITDFQYSLKGYNSNQGNDFTGPEFRYSYIDIIPEIEYKIWNHVVLGAGINYSIKTEEKIKIGNEDWINTNDIKTIKSSDFGMTGKVKVFYKNIFGFIRYNLGLKNIANVTFTDDNGQDLDQGKQLNRNLQIGIGYNLHFKKK